MYGEISTTSLTLYLDATSGTGYAEVKQMNEDIMAKKFTCAQRAQGNFTEQLPLFLVA